MVLKANHMREIVVADFLFPLKIYINKSSSRKTKGHLIYTALDKWVSGYRIDVCTDSVSCLNTCLNLKM